MQQLKAASKAKVLVKAKGGKKFSFKAACMVKTGIKLTIVVATAVTIAELYFCRTFVYGVNRLLCLGASLYMLNYIFERTVRDRPSVSSCRSSNS